MSNYKQLDVWKLSIELTEFIYVCTKSFPKDEIYGLVSQMRRCSVSIASNIAEGSGRASRKEYAHFLSIAYGSCCELETQIVIAARLSYVDKKIATELDIKIASISRMLRALIRSIKKD